MLQKYFRMPKERRFSALAAAFALLLILFVGAPHEWAQNAPKADANGNYGAVGVKDAYYVCYAAASHYVSDVIGPYDGTNGGYDKLVAGFQQFLSEKYKQPVGSFNPSKCFAMATEASARERVANFIGAKTGWKPGATASAANAGTPSAPAAPPAPSSQTQQQPTAQSAAAGQYVLCYSGDSDAPEYMSADFHIDVAPRPDSHSNQTDNGASARALANLQNEYLAYLKKQYGYRGWSPYAATCDGRAASADLTEERSLMHSRFHQMKFVETGWKPGMQATAAAAAAPAQPAASPAMDAYQRALQAQRPQSVSPAQLNASIASASGNYSYCYATGTPNASGSARVRASYYVSSLFAVKDGAHPEDAFQSMLRAAHPQERIGTVNCPAAQKSALETARKQGMDSKADDGVKVVEVDWKPLWNE